MTYAAIFVRAAEVLGGEPQLCRLLGVAKEQCRAWVHGDAQPSAQALAKVVDVLIAHVEGRRLPK